MNIYPISILQTIADIFIVSPALIAMGHVNPQIPILTQLSKSIRVKIRTHSPILFHMFFLQSLTLIFCLVCLLLSLHLWIRKFVVCYNDVENLNEISVQAKTICED